MARLFLRLTDLFENYNIHIFVAKRFSGKFKIKFRMQLKKKNNITDAHFLHSLLLFHIFCMYFFFMSEDITFWHSVCTEFNLKCSRKIFTSCCNTKHQNI